MAPPRLKVTPLPLLLSLNAGFVDTAGSCSPYCRRSACDPFWTFQ